jgi:hypothetical protein
MALIVRSKQEIYEREAPRKKEIRDMRRLLSKRSTDPAACPIMYAAKGRQLAEPQVAQYISRDLSDDGPRIFPQG